MPPSVFSRLWDAVKPPPAVRRPGAKKKKLTARQKRLIYATVAVLATGGLGWAAYAYVASAPERAGKEYQAAMKVMAAGNYKEAITEFTRAVGIWPQLADAYLERGTCHRYLHQNDQAMADFDQAVAVNPNLARAYSARGYIYRERGNPRRAMEEFTKSLNISPNL